MALRPLDPSIVNAYQAPKFNMPDPLQDVAAMEQIKNARMSRQVREQDLASENESRTFLTDIQNRIKQEGGPGLREAVPQFKNILIVLIGWLSTQNLTQKNQVNLQLVQQRHHIPRQNFLCLRQDQKALLPARSKTRCREWQGLL